MRYAFARAALLAAWACSTSCWGQGPAPHTQVTQVSPALQISQLRTRVAKLENENSRLNEQLAAMARGRTGDDRLAVATQRIRELADENKTLRTSLAEANDGIRQRDDELNAARQQLERAQDELKTVQERLQQAQDRMKELETSWGEVQKRLARSEAAVEEQRRLVEDQQRTIGDLRDRISALGRPFWPWGVIAASAALLLGATLTRWLWPRPVGQPLSVDVRLGDWVPGPAPASLMPTPSFGVRSWLLPRSSSVMATREPLVRDVRDAQQGVAS